MCLHMGSASKQRVGQGEVGGVTRRMTCTWWLLVLAVKVPWLGPCWPILALAAWKGLENANCRAFISGREGCLGSEQVFDKREC